MENDCFPYCDTNVTSGAFNLCIADNVFPNDTKGIGTLCSQNSNSANGRLRGSWAAVVVAALLASALLIS